MTTTQLNGNHPGDTTAVEPPLDPASPGPVRSQGVGDLLVAEGLISRAQLEAALRAQEVRGDATPIGQLLVEQGALSRQARDAALARYYRTYRLGDILVQSNVITETQLQLAIDHHRRTGLRLGAALVQLDFLTEQELAHTLCEQLGMTLVDLDGLALDPALAAVIPQAYAEEYRVVPIAKTDEALTVALADPTDWWLGEELEASTGCRVQLVTSTEAAFQRAFARVYGQEPAAGLARRHARLEQARAALARELDGALRALAGLRDAHQALLREQDEALQAAAQQRVQQDTHRQALAELTIAHAALQEEHEARARAYAELGQAQRETLESLATLRAEHARLLEEHGSTARVLAEERERGGDLARALAEIEAAHVVTRRELDERLAALTALDAAYAEATRGLAVLRASHDGLRAEHERVVQELTERAEAAETRQGLAVDQLELLLARLRG